MATGGTGSPTSGRGNGQGSPTPPAQTGSQTAQFMQVPTFTQNINPNTNTLFNPIVVQGQQTAEGCNIAYNNAIVTARNASETQAAIANWSTCMKQVAGGTPPIGLELPSTLPCPIQGQVRINGICQFPTTNPNPNPMNTINNGSTRPSTLANSSLIGNLIKLAILVIILTTGIYYLLHMK